VVYNVDNLIQVSKITSGNIRNLLDHHYLMLVNRGQ
jgi:hypothetical protein